MCQQTQRRATALLAVVAMLGGCAMDPPSPYMSAPPMWETEPAPMQVVRVYEDPPLWQPEPLFIDVAPPPMLVEVIPARPAPDAVWIGGYWGWRSRWVWCNGRWAPPPRQGYVWTNPYYENRGGVVVFVPGFWRPPHVVFAPPPPQLRKRVLRGAQGGVPPVGPSGTFVPAPAGSRPGVVVPPPARWRGAAPTMPQAEPQRVPLPTPEARETRGPVFRARPVPMPPPTPADASRQRGGVVRQAPPPEKAADGQEPSPTPRFHGWGRRNKDAQ